MMCFFLESLRCDRCSAACPWNPDREDQLRHPALGEALLQVLRADEEDGRVVELSAESLAELRCLVASEAPEKNGRT